MSMQFPNGNGQGPVLSDNMPKLSAGLSRGVNKTAVAYIVLVSIATIGMTLWVASNAFSGSEDKKAVKYEEVTVPDKPVLQLAPPPAEVVAKADLPPLPAEMPQQAGAVQPKPVDDLAQRRMASENNLVASSEKGGKKNTLFEDEYSSVKRGAVEVLANADFVLTRGTFIRCSLETKIVSTLPGMTSCIVTEPIYSSNGRRPADRQGL